MITLHRIPEMEIGKKTQISVFLIFYLSCVSVAGRDLPKPDKLMVHIWDGEVTVQWNHPDDAPPNCEYNVQMAKYTDDWAMVDSCTRTSMTYCDLSSVIHDYRTSYKVRVQLTAGDKGSPWISKRFLPTETQLLPPSFTLWATFNTLSIRVHPKPVLKELFPYGVSYTIYLDEEGKDNLTTVTYLNDDMQEDQKATTFVSLHWGKEYCVRIVVQGRGALSISSESPKQCVLLPEPEWFMIAVTSLSILGVLAVIAIIAAILLYYLKRPEKTPGALKSPVSGWLPLSIGEGTMEVVTDKGWFLSSYRTEMKSCVKDPVTHLLATESNGEEDRRTSTDSGISIASSSPSNNRGSPPLRQDDSGCGSLGGSESSNSSQTDYPMQDEKTDTDTVQKREDSGVGLGCQLDSSSMDLDGQDGMHLKEPFAGGNYRGQSPCAVHIHVCDDEELKQILPDTALAEVVTGYRAGASSCICSSTGQCTWCLKQAHYGSQVINQYTPECNDNELLNSKCGLVYKAGLTFSSYSKKSQMDTIMIDDLQQTLIHLGENFPLLTSLSPLHLDEGQDFNMNIVPLSLCDVQLKTD